MGIYEAFWKFFECGVWFRLTLDCPIDDSEVRLDFYNGYSVIQMTKALSFGLYNRP